MSDVERGRRLAELRQAAGMTQPQVALVFEISKQAVGEWEAGKSAPDRRKLARLDALYQSNGQVLALYDVANDEVTKLRDEVAELRRAVRELQEHVKTGAVRRSAAKSGSRATGAVRRSKP